MAPKYVGSRCGRKGSSETWHDAETGQWIIIGRAPYLGEMKCVAFAEDDRHDIGSEISEKGELPKGIDNRIEDFMLGRCHKYSHTPLAELDNDMARVGWQMTA